MKTIVLDDDPTGTQSATGVTVLFDSTVDKLAEALGVADSVYVQTNSRALPVEQAVALVAKIKSDGEAAAERLDDQVRFVLRGDSTLRGHVFAESDVFMDDSAVMLFVPAFPDGGRTTRGGVHYVRVGDRDLPAHESEYAEDPVFGFSTGVLADYVAEKSDRVAVPVTRSQVQAGDLADVLAEAPAGSVILPDAVDANDIAAIAAAVDTATSRGRRVVVRSAAPLAAALAGVTSAGLLPAPLLERPDRVLLVCGSHTLGASAQLEPITAAWGAPAFVRTAETLEDPAAAGLRTAGDVRRRFGGQPVAVLAAERDRLAEHNTLAHGERVMSGLTAAVRDLLPDFGVVVAKGGITSAEVARTGIGATAAFVVGQVLPGVSVWRMEAHDGREMLYVVVPGNVGGPDTLTRVLDALNLQLSPTT